MINKYMTPLSSKAIINLSLWFTLFLAPAIFPQQHLEDEFSGSYRKSVKTSIVRSKSTNHISRTRKFNDLGDLILFLPNDIAMRKKYNDLKIQPEGPENRKTEELFNVQVDCWVYAVKYEGGAGDKDFHIIMGDSPDSSSATYMNVEVSALPVSESINYEPLRTARKQFLALFSGYNFNGSFSRINPPLMEIFLRPTFPWRDLTAIPLSSSRGMGRVLSMIRAVTIP